MANRKTDVPKERVLEPIQKPSPKVEAPTDLDFEKALMFFHAYMYGPLQGKLRLYRARGVHSVGKALSSDWEVFASILVKDVGTKLTHGVDLSQFEVKSAEQGGSFEYQYHRNTGIQKLRSDMEVGHLFFSHADDLGKVELRYLHGTALKEYFESWLKLYPDPYPQRYRKSIPFGVVSRIGDLLMRIEKGEITFPELDQVPVSEAVPVVKKRTKPRK